MNLQDFLGTKDQYIINSVEWFLANNNKFENPSDLISFIKEKLNVSGKTISSSLRTSLSKYTEGTPNFSGTKIFIRKGTPFLYKLDETIHSKLLLKDKDLIDTKHILDIFYKDKIAIIDNDDNDDYNVLESSIKQAICILGDSGNGKTFTTMETLKKEKHKILYQIIDEYQEHLLYEYLPHEQKYELSIIGEFILEANSKPNVLYTIVFDECHKYLDKVNNSLLQCLSLERNDGERFLQKDRRINDLFDELENSIYGKKIPDNLGFVFISSKPSNIEANEDFKNRLKFYEIRKDFENTNFTLDYIKSIEYEFDS